MLRHAHSVYNVIAFLGAGVGRNLSELFIIHHPAAAALHLGVQHIGHDVLHKQHDFQGLYVGAGGDQRHRDGDAEVFFNAKIANQAVGIA